MFPPCPCSAGASSAAFADDPRGSMLTARLIMTLRQSPPRNDLLQRHPAAAAVAERVLVLQSPVYILILAAWAWLRSYRLLRQAVVGDLHRHRRHVPDGVGCSFLRLGASHVRHRRGGLPFFSVATKLVPGSKPGPVLGLARHAARAKAGFASSLRCCSRSASSQCPHGRYRRHVDRLAGNGLRDPRRVFGPSRTSTTCCSAGPSSG